MLGPDSTAARNFPLALQVKTKIGAIIAPMSLSNKQKAKASKNKQKAEQKSGRKPFNG